ncbi:MAG: CPBP family intramembrane metalloprotease [Flavobacteriaceae bacterium]|nr:CPBP family intramembrane metalloprotease [Flavobacteriaceae bacterium]
MLPILVWVGMILFFLNIKNIPYDFSEKDAMVVRLIAKVLYTIVLPLILIRFIYKEKSDFGIYFPRVRESMKLTWRALSIAGPAAMTFPLIGWLGWSFADWRGSLMLSLAFFAVFYFIPKITSSLPTRNNLSIPNNRIYGLTLLSILTIGITYSTYHILPIFWKLCYYALIVGFGEELFFRGYLQSALNRYFGKSFSLGKVQFGWGLILAALLFGLSHALLTVPPTWPWALWTFIFGLTLGFIREKDGSILAAVLLHAIMDLPLAFMTVS